MELDGFDAAICARVCWFNTDRLHSDLDDCAPAQVEAAWHRDHLRTDAA